jgi:FlaG/FlaF family flagellin (archaellin)
MCRLAWWFDPNEIDPPLHTQFQRKYMHYLKRITRKNGDEAVSPVVGVMLMLVVTIIIAAVVSGFAGGLMGGNNQKAPTLAMDVKVSNTGTWVGSGFSATVTSVSEPIATKNIKIVTSWTTTMKDNTSYQSVSNGAAFVGGSTVYPLSANANYTVPASGGTGKPNNMTAPFGSGPGVTNFNPTAPNAEQQFGNFTLTQGTGLYALPFGTTSGKAIGGSTGSSASDGYGVLTVYTYTAGSDYTTDPTQAVLGTGWENLRAGDTVSVRFIHVPSGKVILQKDVTVTEG